MIKSLIGMLLGFLLTAFLLLLYGDVISCRLKYGNKYKLK